MKQRQNKLNLSSGGLLELRTSTQKSLIQTLNILIKTEQMSRSSLKEKQLLHLSKVCKYSAENSTHFRERLILSDVNIDSATGEEILDQLKPLSRQAIQLAGQTFFSKSLPKNHGHVGSTTTSGSSGEPVVIQRSMINQLYWMAYTIREHLWFKRDFSLSLGIIRASSFHDAIENDNWGSPTALVYHTGKSFSLPINTDLDAQLDWLKKVSPHYLLTYPTNLEALIDLLDSGRIKLDQLKELRTIGETLTPQLILKAQKVLGLRICDSYSSQEIGYIAQQCPEAGLYHIADTVMVEVLDESGRHCSEGEIGKIIVSDLINYASPLIRYDIGDYAEVGPIQCSCGRPTRTLSRIFGRQRNMIIFPDGKRHWPLVGFSKYREIAPIRQYQLIQKDRENIDVKLVVDEKLNSSKLNKLRNVIQESLGYNFNLNFIILSENIPRSKGGKFEEFICEAN